VGCAVTIIPVEAENPNYPKGKKIASMTWLLKQAKAKGAVILFADEVSFARWGSLARTWAPTGEQSVVKTTGTRKGLKIFGAIDFHRGQFQFMESLYYRLTPKSFKQLKADGLPSEVVEKYQA